MGIFKKSKPLIAPEVIGKFEAVKTPPPLVFKFRGEGHKPALWCREVCRKPQEHEFAAPPWMRHSQSWNKDLLDFHKDPEPNIPIPMPKEMLHPSGLALPLA